MSKYYEILITVEKSYAVEIEDDETPDDAVSRLEDELSGEDFTVNDKTIIGGKKDFDKVQSLYDEIVWI